MRENIDKIIGASSHILDLRDQLNIIIDEYEINREKINFDKIVNKAASIIDGSLNKEEINTALLLLADPSKVVGQATISGNVSMILDKLDG
jgi:hypothetical protein